MEDKSTGGQKGEQNRGPTEVRRLESKEGTLWKHGSL